MIEPDFEVECRGLWKVYGRRAGEAMAAVRDEGLSKEEVRDRFGCVLGVRDVNLKVRKGEVFCVMGLSGSGKSTLLRHINRLVEATRGEVFVAGERVDQMDRRRLRELRSKTVGMVFQGGALWPHRTLAEVAAFGLEARGVDAAGCRKAAERVLSAVGLEGWEDYYPDQLSGGMQQRVGLARALAADPRVLLLDEPFSALDPLIRRQLQDRFLYLGRELGKTVVFVTHDLDEAIRMGDRIAIMDDGVIVQTGTPEEIVTNPINSYVAEFVKGVGRTNLVRAETIMVPLDELGAGGGQGANARYVGCDSFLGEVIDQFLEAQSPVVVTGPEGQAVGGITVEAVLRAIKG